MEHTKHLWRAFGILLLAAVIGVIGRHFMIPASFGMFGAYRYEALQEASAKPVVHGSLTSCRECHAETAEAKLAGKHAPVSCEVCHAPLTTHAADGEKIADMPINRTPELCLGCHQKLRARPEDMPQIDMTEHLTLMDMMPEEGQSLDGLCMTCHDVHDPSL